MKNRYKIFSMGIVGFTCLLILGCYFFQSYSFAPFTSSTLPLKEKWSRNLRDNITEISGTEDGRFIFARTTNTVYALETNTGDVKWSFSLTPQVEMSPPIVANDKIYVADSNTLWALNLENGQPTWKQPLLEPRGWVTDATTKAVLVNQISTDIRAYDAATGHLLWSVDVGAGPIHAYIDDNLVYVPDYGIKAINLLTGETVWSKGTAVIGESGYKNGVIYFTSEDNIVTFDTRQQKEIWRKTFSSNGFRKFKISDNIVFVTDADYLYAFNILNGNLMWKEALEQPENPSIIEGRVYVTEGFNRVIQAFDIETGKNLGSLRISLPKLLITENQDVAAVGDMLLVSKGKKLFAYQK